MHKAKTLITLGGAAIVGAVLIAQTGNQAGRDWPYHLGDQGGTRFSTLNQINVSNVSNLKRAWTFKTGSGRFASSPMVVDSVMYFSAPNGVYAIDAVTGVQLWKYAPETASTAPAAPPASAAPPAAAAPSAAPAGAPPAEAGRGQGPGGFGRGRGGRGGGTAGTALRGPMYWG